MATVSNVSWFHKVQTRFRHIQIVEQLRQVNKKIQYSSLGKRFLKLIFSHAGLFTVILAYTIFGAWFFQLCELDDLYQKNIDTNQKTQEIDELRLMLANHLKELGALGPAHWNSTVTRDVLKEWLDEYQAYIQDAIQNHGYTGVLVDTPGVKWSIASAILFTLTIITTVGYGHVTPVTEMGRFLVIPYALLGIPFFLIFLTDHGIAVGCLLRRLFLHVCCYGPHKTRQTNLEIALYLKTHRKSFIHDKVLYTLESKYTVAQSIETKKHEMHNDDAHVPVSLLFFLIIVFLVIGMVMFWQTEGWTLVQSGYFCFVTLLTIGFGDYVPGYLNVDTTTGKVRLIVACLYIVVGLAIITMGVSLIVDELFNSAKKLTNKLEFLREEIEMREAENTDDKTRRSTVATI